MTNIIVTPAKINLNPSLEKYYGVYPKTQGYESRMFIVSAGGTYPKATRFKVICFYLNLQCNTYETITQINDSEHANKLNTLIIRLIEKGFDVVEFDSHRDLANWLADMSPDYVPFRKGDKVKERSGNTVMTIKSVVKCSGFMKDFPMYEYYTEEGNWIKSNNNLRLVKRVESKEKVLTHNE